MEIHNFSYGASPDYILRTNDVTNKYNGLVMWDYVGNMIWYWSNQSQHGDNITVVATLSGVVYTCVALNEVGKNLGNASINVVANGK